MFQHWIWGVWSPSLAGSPSLRKSLVGKGLEWRSRRAVACTNVPGFMCQCFWKVFPMSQSTAKYHRHLPKAKTTFKTWGLCWKFRTLPVTSSSSGGWSCLCVCFSKILSLITDFWYFCRCGVFECRQWQTSQRTRWHHWCGMRWRALAGIDRIYWCLGMKQHRWPS